MNLKTLALFFVFSVLVQTANAQFFRTQVNVQVNSYQAMAQVVNMYPAPIHCWGNVSGMTYRGFTAWAGFDQIIPMGQYRYAFLNTAPNDPFIRANADIICRFISWMY